MAFEKASEGILDALRGIVPVKVTELGVGGRVGFDKKGVIAHLFGYHDDGKKEE